MSNPQIDNLVGTKQLKAEPPAGFELLGQMRSGKRRLDDASLPSPDPGDSFRPHL